jgi:lysyl oxidase
MKAVRQSRSAIFSLSLLLSACGLEIGEDTDLTNVGAVTTGPLKSSAQTLLWSGTVEPGDPTPAVCEGNPCDSFPLTVALPTDVWTGHAGAVQVAVRWPFVFDSLSLYVTQGSTLIASATGEISEGEILMMPNLPNGNYTIYVAWNPISADTSISYDLLAEVEYNLNALPAGDRLPDLQMRTSPNVTFNTPSFPIFGWPEPAPGDTCFPIETQEEGAQTCLRFDQVLANRGEGNLEMRLAIPNDPEDPSTDALQRITRTDGTSYDRVAGEWEFHPSHDHYHYKGFAQARLWNADSHGKRLGSAPVRQGRKVSFCIIDVRIDAWAQKGDVPRNYRVPTCLFPTDGDDAFSYIVSGVTRGWADIYDWFLPDQYIEVSGLPNGIYVVESVADPDNGILEANEANNCFGNVIRLENVDLPSRSVTILGDAKKCGLEPM